MSALPPVVAAVDVAAARVRDHWAWIVPLVSVLVIVALVALILGTTMFAADPMTGT